MKKTSKILSVIMAVLMVLAAIPMTAFAAIPTVELNEVTTASVPEDDYARFIFTPAESGKYVVITDNGGDDDIDPYVEIYDDNDDMIADNDDNDYAATYNSYCEFEAEAGEDYYILLGEFDYKEVEYDFVIRWYGEIDHQPTADEPYVTLTAEADAEYQWYKVGDIVEVTDENATADEYKGSYATYDSENGWTGVYGNYSYEEEGVEYFEYYFFKADLKEGEIISITPGTFAYDFDLYCDCEIDGGDWDNLEAGNTINHMATHDCEYCVYGDFEEVPDIKAEIIKNEAVDGATDAEFTPEEPGEYFCIVTFDGCRREISDTIEITDLSAYCDCKCHQGGIAGFFYKIVLFFQKLFGQNLVCECGMKH